MLCRLCLKDSPLCRSHIVPEFAFKPMYDANHRFIEVTSVKDQKIKQGQQGWWERMLCAECETRLNRYERHVRRMFVDPLPPPVVGKRTFEFPNIEYKLLKLFILSILWRASVSTLDECRHVSLGPHEDILRELILTDALVDPEIYPCLLFLLFDGDRHFNDVMAEPTYHKEQGLRCYRFIVRGFMYFIYVGSHLVSLPSPQLILGRHNPVRGFSGNWDDFAFLRKSLVDAANVPD